MSAFGAPGQLAARGASRRPDAVQAARRNLTKSVRRTAELPARGASTWSLALHVRVPLGTRPMRV
jgi:hypothetical protein